MLRVAAKLTQIRICDAVHTLKMLPNLFDEYERISAPRIARPSVICYECGGEGHIARYCPERSEEDFNEELGLVLA